MVTQDEVSGENEVKLTFSENYTFRNAFVKFAAYGMMGRNFMFVSNDDINYKEVAFAKRGQIYDDIACFEFEPVTAKYVKFVFKPTDNKLLYTAMPKVTVAVREISLDNRQKIKDWCKKAAHSFPFFDPQAERKEFAKSSPAGSSIAADSIVDVSQYLDENGKLDWVAPSDNWTIIRFGMASTEAINRPGSAGGEGLEVDKMNTDALDLHFSGLLREAKDLAGDKVGNTFMGTHVDSWEVGRQNWTQDFAESFTHKNGYSPLLFLPATLGYTINNPNVTERFLWDLRKSIADLIAERFYGGMRKRANAMGIKFSAQSMKPFIDNLYALGQADIVSANSNFSGLPSHNNLRSQKNAYLTAKMTASAGSIYGRFVNSESFTALPEANRWLNHPESYKPQADIDLAAGVNQITHHLFTHQPWLTLQPGMTLNYWGVHCERTQTWWHETPTWNRYLSTVQSVLSQGQPVFDILHLLGDDSSTKSDSHFVDNLLPQGYDFEFISTHGLLHKLYVNDAKKLAYETGRQYSLLNLADDVSMRPEVLGKIEELLKQGAIIVGKPPTFSPSLQNHASSDNDLRSIAQRIWGGKYSTQVFINIEDAFEALRLAPDLNITGARSKLVWRHHHIATSNQDIYFISNVGAKPSQFEAKFRVTNKQPELWNPFTGERKLIKKFKQTSDYTSIELDIEQVESYFIVFSNAASTDNLLNSSTLEVSKIVDTPWNIEFIKGVDKPNAINMTTLIDLKDHVIDNIKYFSGTARYSTHFEYSPNKRYDYVLDLGTVHQFARVTINGHDLGVRMWHPYRFDLSRHLIKGSNTLEIEITNLWPNRLIGDERQFTDSANWVKNGYQGEQLVELPDWLTGARPQQPGERHTFATWKHWSKDDALIPSGLIGPVTIKRKNVKACNPCL
ncbi:glycosyl hydrolase [Glaciecola sp. SC05]|uniref:glycosyl hydrolase n=1 Tax=Glaciecola sp. SC05 TaxID=1987355 RepID=UPI0035271DAF